MTGEVIVTIRRWMQKGKRRMLRHEIQWPPEHIYPIEEWRFVENRFDERRLDLTETMFTTANGYMGHRGTLEEARPIVRQGSFVTGFCETWPIEYAEEAYGFARTGQTIVNLPNAMIIRTYVDDEPFFLPTARLRHYERALDLREGVLTRDLLWETPAGKQVRIRTCRFVSLEHRHLAAVSFELTLLNASAPVVVSSEMMDTWLSPQFDPDPRRSRGFSEAPLIPHISKHDHTRFILGFRTRQSGMTMACGCEHVIDMQADHTLDRDCREDAARLVLSAELKPDESIRFVKYISYHTSRSAPPAELAQRAGWTLDRAVRTGFEALRESQRQRVSRFWASSDVQVDSDNPRLQQCLRLNLFHMLQASARVEGGSIPAKGLTGDGYQGQYFWDTEIYVLPFLVYNIPHVARNILRFRHSLIDYARDRARELGHRGAMFPWRTIRGDEASAYYAAGTAQYHINADIIYGLRKYVEIAGSETFLRDFGCEMLVETARMWVDMGFFSERNGGAFCIDGVTGPDEYTAVENNNLYTNLMARHNLLYAVEVTRRLSEEHPAAFAAVRHRTGLKIAEIDEWEAAGTKMYIPYDEALGIHPQDDGFLDRKRWNLEATPPEKFPLMLHYHPLNIYRHQIIKQADVVLAMFLLSPEFTREQKRRNFDYYDPMTTSDSSLSPCIQSIIAAEVGHADLAMEYFNFSAMMDLADLAGNVRDGLHVASIGGTWMALVFGFAGMRDTGGTLSFDPRLPEKWTRLAFHLHVQGRKLSCTFNHAEAGYHLEGKHELRIVHEGRELTLTPGDTVKVEVTFPHEVL